MLPLSLTVRDFLSYGPEAQTLSFEGLDLVCLTGPNGAGKSALFDAITWALWARARTRAPDDLVRRGAESAAVAFRFAVAGERYRVARSYNRRARKHDATLAHETDGEPPAIIAQGVKAVAQAVAELIKLPYETFVASVYLKQGQAAFFMRSLTARGRKELLFSLLGLDHVRALGEQAAAATKDSRERLSRVEAEVAALEREAAGIEDARYEAAAATKRNRATQRRAAAAGARVELARQREAELRERFTAYREKSSRLGEVNIALTSARAREREAAQERTTLEKAVVERESIIAAYRELEKARRRLRTLEEKGRRWRAINARSEEIRAASEERRRAAERKLALAEERERRAEEALAALAEVVAELPARKRAAQEYVAAQDRFRRLKEREREWRAGERRLADARAAYEREEAVARAALANLRNALTKWEQFDYRVAQARAQAAAVGRKRDALQEELARGEREAARAAAVGSRLTAAAREAEVARERLNLLRERVADLTRDARACPICDRPFDDASRAAARRHLTEEIVAEEAAAEKLAAEVEELQGELAGAQKKTRRLAEVKKRLAAAAEEWGQQQQVLAALDRESAERDAVMAEVARAEQRVRELVSSPLAARVAAARGSLQAIAFQPAALAAAEKEVAALEPARYRLEEAVRAQRERDQKKREQGRAEALCRELRTALAGDFLNAAERGALLQNEHEAATLAFDDAALEEARRNVAALTPAERRYRELEVAQERLVAARERYAKAAAEATEYAAAREKLRAALEGESDVAAALSQARDELAAATAAEHAATQALRSAAEELGAAKAKVARLTATAQRLAEARAELKALRRGHAMDRYLAAAFGPDGIPALMTEQALAELEEGANDVLARLSDGRTALYIETQREKKTGGVVETLDVGLQENGIPRPYESFSGGEAFRADFSLRIALSQLLARRAGVPLRFLVIDEGFGTQDEEGLAALVEAIGAVRDDFAHILVISHLADVREMFAKRIEVYKDAEGFSRFRVLK